MQIEAPRLVRLRFPDWCFVCARELERGDHVWWNSERRFVTCGSCFARDISLDDNPPDLLSPLRWAQDVRKHERARDRRLEQQRELDVLGRIGADIWDIASERPSAAIWRGARDDGRRIVGAMLDVLVPRGVVVLHDVRMREEQRHIDHVVIARSGVHIVQSVQRDDERVDVKRLGPLLARETHLFVGGRDHTVLAAELDYQIGKIRELVGGSDAAALTTITPVLCFVNAQWTWPRRRLAIGDIEILWPRALLTLLSRPGPLERHHIEELGGRIASRLVYERP